MLKSPIQDPNAYTLQPIEALAQIRREINRTWLWTSQRAVIDTIMASDNIQADCGIEYTPGQWPCVIIRRITTTNDRIWKAAVGRL